MTRTPEERAKRAARMREYYHTHPERVKERAARGRRKLIDPIKRAARTAVSNALRDGRIIKPIFCPECGIPGGRMTAHHRDYTKPLEVEWLCTRCHGLRHRKLETDAYGRLFPF